MTREDDPRKECRGSRIQGAEIETYLLPFRLIGGSDSQYQLGDYDRIQCLTVLLLGLVGSGYLSQFVKCISSAWNGQIFFNNSNLSITGKSTLVEVLGNYILGVEFRDVDRFQVRRKDGPTDTITSYTFFTRYTQRFPRPITLIDTPGFQRGTPGDDQMLMNNIRTFIRLHHKQGIDAIIYVVPGPQVVFASPIAFRSVALL